MQKIKINDKEYNIVFNFGVIKEVCKECGCNTPTLIQRLSEGDLEVIYSVLKHGILFNHKDFDAMDIDKLSLQDTFKTFEVIGKLLSDNMPKGDNEKKMVK